MRTHSRIHTGAGARAVVRALGFALALLTCSACFDPPSLSGSDQVPDENVVATAIKDNKFESLHWDAVDNEMLQLVPDPTTEAGCAVGVVRDHEVVYLQGYGWARVPGLPGAGEKWGVGTVGAVGSISKTLTAAAALQMHEQGLINVNLQIDHYLSTTNAKLGNRMVFSLLDHASGIGGATKAAAFAPNWEPGSATQNCIDNDPDGLTLWCQTLSQTLAQPSAAFTEYEDNEAVKLNLPAGTGIYSNVGYSVMGAVMDEVIQDQNLASGYEAFVWDRIGEWSDNLFESGHMLSLVLTHSWRANDIPHRAIGYADGNGPVFEAWDDTGQIEGWEGPSGGWAMTIGDLSRFMIALDEGRFFADGESSALLTAMRMPWTDLAGFGDDYGAGMFIGDPTLLTSPDFSHGGVIGGHRALWAYWQDFYGHEVGVAMICNRGDVGTDDLTAHAVDIAQYAAFGQDPEPDPVIVYVPYPVPDPGTTWRLDIASARQVSPQGAFIPLTALSNDLELTTTALKGGAPGMQLSEYRSHLPSSRPLRQTSLGPARFVSVNSTTFDTPPRPVTLETEVGDLVIQGFRVQGTLAANGAELAEVALSGDLDARQSLLMPWQDVCRDLAEAGSPCEPCSDGAPACVHVRFEGLRGKKR